MSSIAHSARLAASLTLVLLAGGCRRGATATLADAPPATPPSAFAVDSALQRVGASPLWPGFDPLGIPVAIVDGRTTVLFRHPAPPAEYSSLPRLSGAAAREGRDPLITANTSVTLGGVPTATVILPVDGRSSAADLAPLATHELFHVFQRARHPTWRGNEADLFTYPVDDAAALALRREETKALRLALAATRADSLRCWARVALTARRARFEALGGAAAAYERGTELNEGLARYVELRAAGRTVSLPGTDFPADQVRQRSYEIGAAIGQVLDRVRPAWRDRLERAPAGDSLTLDGMLGSALAENPPVSSCALSGAEREQLAAQARVDVAGVRERRQRQRAEFLAQHGWRLVVESGSGPLWPQGFDPLNVQRVTPGEIIHSRFVRLGNDAGWIELLDRASLSEGRAGQHPLFGGVTRLTVGGFASAPVVRDSSGVLVVEGPGLRSRLRGARADTVGTSIRVTMR